MLPTKLLGLSTIRVKLRIRSIHSRVVPSRKNKEVHEDADKVASIPEDDKLLEEIIAEDDNKSSADLQGPQYWRRQYNKSLKKARKGMDQKLQERFEYSLPKVESYNESHKLAPLQRLRVNPASSRLTLSQLISDRSLRQAIISYMNSSTPSAFQRRFWSLMTGYLSTIAKGDQGSGRSTAIAVSALALKRIRNRGPGINSLIVVKSTNMVLQYERMIKDILKALPGEHQWDNYEAVAQFQYRADDETELRQQSVLANTPEPHILVTTPQRMLDILSTRGMEFLKVNSLSAIFVDDFDSMVDGEDYLQTKKKTPVVQLLDYVVKLQDYRRQHNEPHPQIIFTVSNTCTNSLLEQVREGTEWFDWSKFAPLGTYDGDTDVPSRKGVPCNVAISSVFVDPYVGEKNQKKFKVKLYDMVPFEYGSNMSVWLDKLYRSMEGNDYLYRKNRNTKKAAMSQEVKSGSLEVLVSGFIKLAKKKDCNNLKDEKILMVYPDEVSDKQLKDILEKSKKRVRVFDDEVDSDFFVRSSGEEEAQILMINASSLTGLTFKGLKNVVLLGIDTIKNVQGLVNIAGRFRDDSGLILERLFPPFSESSSSSIQNRIYLLNSKLDFEDLERNFLERTLIKAGLVNQFSSVGVIEPDFDKESYEGKFTSDYGFSSHDES
ncbi:DEKNAAC101218 [Brettanomyces naardenensis]|uniref:ATP-dependent RNA helicase n=1 Tax=Brettanomyces naardenensis TaxID=13370 RepID=A0A448YH74_BRENA|nr:DEKNAAC101218 [Brettanomyces naardenensis]